MTMESEAKLLHKTAFFVMLCHEISLFATSSRVLWVGLQVWRGAFLLADYILAHQKEFEDLNVLELASGTHSDLAYDKNFLRQKF